MSNQDIEKLHKELNLLIKENKKLNHIVKNTEPACNNCKGNLVDAINKKMEDLKKEKRDIAFLNDNSKKPTTCA